MTVEVVVVGFSFFTLADHIMLHTRLMVLIFMQQNLLTV